MSTDNTERIQRGKPFQQGQSGNPSGRPKGSRNKLSEFYLSALAEDFEEHGKSAIKEVRKTDPKAYLQIITVLIGKLPIEKNEPDGSLIANRKVMIVVDHGTDEEWEAKALAQQTKLVEEAKTQK